MAYVISGYCETGYVAEHAVKFNPMIIWDSRLADATPSASTTISGSAANLADFRPYTSWKPASIPAHVTVDCGSVKSADSLSMFNHDLYSKGCWIEVRGSTDNFVSSDVLITSHFPASDHPFHKHFTSASYRYWRIRVVGVSLPTLSVVAIGVSLEFPSGLPYGFDPLARKVFGQTNVSEAGLPLGKAVLYEQWDANLNWPHIETAWARNSLLPAWKGGIRGNPCLFAWDLTNYPDEFYLAEAGDSLSVKQVLPTYSSVAFSLKGVALP